MMSNVKIELRYEIKAFTSQTNIILIRYSIASKINRPVKAKSVAHLDISHGLNDALSFIMSPRYDLVRK